MPVYYIVMAAGAAAVGGSAAAVRILKKEKVGLLLKIVALVFLAAFFARFFFFGDEYIMNSSALSVPEGFANKTSVAAGVFQLWFSVTAAMLVVLSPFYRADWLDRLTASAGMPVYILNAVFFKNFLTATGGAALAESVGARGIFMALETGMGLAASVFVFCVSFPTWKKSFRPEARPYLLAAAGIAAMFVCSMPDYALSVLLGDGPGSVRILDLTFEHRLFLYMAALIPIAAPHFINATAQPARPTPDPYRTTREAPSRSLPLPASAARTNRLKICLDFLPLRHYNSTCLLQV